MQSKPIDIIDSFFVNGNVISLRKFSKQYYMPFIIDIVSPVFVLSNVFVGRNKNKEWYLWLCSGKSTYKLSGIFFNKKNAWILNKEFNAMWERNKEKYKLYISAKKNLDITYKEKIKKPF